jgi:avidin family protein
MSWTGTWKNQYGSVVEISSATNGRIGGLFRTALEDSAFYGQNVPIAGVYNGNCISFAAAGRGPTGDVVVSYAGLLRERKLETVWYLVADAALRADGEGQAARIEPLNWWRAVSTNTDTFERVGEDG